MHFERVVLLLTALFLTGCSGVATRGRRTEKTPVRIDRVSRFGAGHLLSPVSISTDIQGCIYVGDEARVGVHKFRPDFSYEMAFGDFGQDESQLLTPVDLFCDGFYVYVVDGRNERIAKYDRYGGFVRVFSPVGTDTLGSGLPLAVAVSSGGEIYILKTRPAQVLVLDEYGRIKSAFGSFGGESGLTMPTSMALGPDSEVYVCDRGSRRIVSYDPFGGFLGEIKGLGSPSDVAVDMAGNVYVSDLDAGTVICYDREGVAVASLVGLAAPRALTLTGENTLLVVDSEDGSVVVCRIYYR
jgi:hypothetical protein